MKCIIVEDELPAVEILKSHLSHFSEIELVKICHSAMETVQYLSSNHVDILFLDIQMPKMNGLQMLTALKSRPNVIITTAFREYALQGFELEVTDYLLKPISLERFSKAIAKVLSSQSSKNYESVNTPPSLLSEPFIYVKVDREYQKIELSKLLYIESLRNHIKLVTLDKSYITLMPLAEIELKLPQYFLRVHRSFVVSSLHIDRFTQTDLVIHKKIIPIGNYYKQNFKNWVVEHL